MQAIGGFVPHPFIRSIAEQVLTLINDDAPVGHGEPLLA
jgi:hypothetical protein